MSNPYTDRFDRLFAAGQQLVLAGEHQRDGPPADGGRWGISAVLRPDPAAAARIDAAAAEALAVAGPGHWPTGSSAVSHFTVLPIEPYRHLVPDDDADVARYIAGVNKAAGAGRPVSMHLRGVTISPIATLMCAYPDDDAAEALAANLRLALGDDHWPARDIWYATLVHFTGPIPYRQALMDWVAARRSVDFGPVQFDELQLVGWRMDGPSPQLVPLASASLTGGDNG